MQTTTTRTHHHVRSFLLWTFVLSWIPILLAALYQGYDLHNRWFGGTEPEVAGLPLSTFVLGGLIAQFMPSVVAIGLVRRHGGSTHMRSFLRRALPERAQLKGYVAIVVGMALLMTITIAIYVLFGGPTPDFPEAHPALYYVGFLPAILIGLLFGGLSEEYGWRGYLQPILQRSRSPIVVSLIIAVLWTLWHLEPSTLALAFSDGIGDFLGQVVSEMSQRLLQTIPHTIVFTYVYNRFRGGLFAIILLHAAGNAANDTASLAWTDPPSDWTGTLLLTAMWAVVAAVLIARTQGRLGFNSDDDRLVAVVPDDAEAGASQP